MTTPDIPLKGRFAPSPSGRMHLGNIFAAVISYASVKSRGGKWLLRIEDLDPQRSKREFSELIEDDLHWLGLRYDEGGLEDSGPHSPYCQSERHNYYHSALQVLCNRRLIYPCKCTRAEINASNAPHASDGRVIYPGTCRPEEIVDADIDCAEFKGRNLRILLPADTIEFSDLHYGNRRVNLGEEFGDIVLRRADDNWAYQLAVVTDDALMGVTEVCRGVDLIDSTALQIYLQQQLGFPTPQYLHFPLLTDREGRRLSKRDKALAMDVLRDRFTAEELIGKIAVLSGQIDAYRPMDIEEFVALFDSSRLPRHNVCAY